MQAFLDATGGHWVTGALIGKVGSAFTSTASQHGGQETTLLAMHTFFFHQGMVVTGVPYSAQELLNLDEMTGGTPYGASTIAGPRGERQPTPTSWPSPAPRAGTSPRSPRSWRRSRLNDRAGGNNRDWILSGP